MSSCWDGVGRKGGIGVVVVVLCARLRSDAVTQVKIEIERHSRREEDMDAGNLRTTQKQSE
jgi:hypothetical protein